jgi:signal transduction histidine kinase/HAMP domain-containing protein
MTIKKKFYLMLGISVLLFILSGSAILSVRTLESQTRQQLIVTDETVHLVFNLSQLANEYREKQLERVTVQWDAAVAELLQNTRQIDTKNSKITKETATIIKTAQTMDLLFDTFSGSNSSRQGFAKNVVFDQVSIYQQTMFSAAHRIRMHLEEKTTRLSQLLMLMVMLLFLACMAFLGLNSHFMVNSLYQTASQMLKGMDQLKTGDLETVINVDSQDELGRLATSFNEMVSSLKTVTASRDDLDREIEARKGVEQELHKNWQTLITILDYFPEIIYVADPMTYEVILVNKKFADMLQGDPVGKKCYNQFQGLDEPCPFCTNERLFKEGQVVWQHHNALVNVDYLINDQLIQWVDGSTVRFELAVDITEQKRNLETIEKLNSDLQDKNQELEQVVYVTSHDLRSPLVNIQGFSKELTTAIDQLRSLDKNDDTGPAMTFDEIMDDMKFSLNYIKQGITKMDQLLAGLLRLSRLGRQQITPAGINVNELVRAVLDTHQFQVKELGIVVETGDLPVCIADEAMLNQVFSNLVDNAIKYRSPDRNLHLSITGEIQGDYAIYHVADNGIGIQEEHIENIFNIFHRLDPAATDGEGLGLTVVRRILDKNGGGITVQSNPGSGSVFTVSLPVHI